MTDSIIFDLDGTLWDSTEVIAESWTTVVEKITGVKRQFTSEELKKLFGLPVAEIAKKIFPAESPDRQLQLIDLCCQEEHLALQKKSGTLFPEIEETLILLSKKYKLFIVSNCQAGYIELFYELTGLGHYFQDFECPGRTGLYKADNIRLVIERNNLTNPVYVGDTSGDESASKKAGVPFIFASYGFGSAESPDEIINNFIDLQALLLKK